MHELEVLLSRLKMEHLSYHVESLLEQADKKEIRDQECRPSELAQTIWEHPYVAKAHRRTHTGQNKAE